jgi:cAMP-specific phosphodiesterase 4
MCDIDLWGIDIFLIDELSNHRPLTTVAYNIFKKRDFLNKFQISPHTLNNFLNTLEEHYQLVPYHNKIHAADVTQSIHVLLNTNALEVIFL